jgi:hypothetical protein
VRWQAKLKKQQHRKLTDAPTIRKITLQKVQISFGIQGAGPIRRLEAFEVCFHLCEHLAERKDSSSTVIDSVPARRILPILFCMAPI